MIKNFDLVFKNQFFKYFLVAGFCFTLDLVLFSVFKWAFLGLSLGLSVMFAAVLARVISSAINYFLNRNKVFDNSKSGNYDKNSLINYYGLVAFQLLMSIVWTVVLSKALALNPIIAKVFVDVIIFVVNFVVQKKIIFRSKTNFIEKIIDFSRKNPSLVAVLIIYTALHLAAMAQLGIDYNLGSDDLSYINAGIDLAENGVISMHGVISAQIMPMMNFMIALLSLFFSGKWLWLSLKILWLLFWLGSIILLFFTIKRFTGNKVAIVGCLPMILPEFVWMNNLILTETPFVLGVLGALYFSFELEKTKSTKSLVKMTLFYLFATLFKANFAPYPLFLAIYLIIKKYDFRLMIRQIAIASVMVSVFFVPWIIRNYSIFGEFIPLTYGGGNPMLLGTYQGVGYPTGQLSDYDQYLKSVATKEMTDFLNGKDMPAYKKSYYSLRRDGLVAKKRMSDWWQKDKVGFLKSYLIIKPKILIKNVFYWKGIFNVPAQPLNLIRRLLLIVTFLSAIGIVIAKKNVVEMVFVLVNYLFQIFVYSMTFAFDRYHQSIWPMSLIVTAVGIHCWINLINAWRKRGFIN